MRNRSILYLLSAALSCLILAPSLRAEGPEGEGSRAPRRFAPIGGLHGVPSAPGQTVKQWGTIEGDVNLFSSHGFFTIPLYELRGRGSVALPIQMYYSTEVSDIETAKNEDMQASWVGMGWGLEAPFVFATISPDIYGSSPNRTIEDVNFTYTLYWGGTHDPMTTTSLKFRSKWKVATTTDGNGYVSTFTLTDIDGTEYTFGNRRETVVSIHDDVEGEMEDYAADVPYRWDLTGIEDVTGQNSITLSYQDVTGYVEEEISYTQASYLYRITDDASGRVVEFVRESRTDYDSDWEEWLEYAIIFEMQRLNYFYLKPSAGSGTVIAKFDLSYASYRGSGDYQKLMLGDVEQKKKGLSDALPSWKFTYRTSNPNDGALLTLTYPEGAVRTFTYGNMGASGAPYKVKSVALDRGMGAGSETTTYVPQDSTGGASNVYYYTEMKVVPPGSIGYTVYEMLSAAGYGNNAGCLDEVRIYNNSSTLVDKIEYTPEDTTIVMRVYSLVRHTLYQGGSTLVSDTEYTYNSTNGRPSVINDQVRPFQPRSSYLEDDPAEIDKYFRKREITYAYENYSSMNANGTHQLSAVWKEVVREEVRTTESGTQRSPVSATWTTYSLYNSTYYAPYKTWQWTASSVSDTSLQADPPGDTQEKVVTREVQSMDAYGHVLQEKDGEGAITKYYYGDNSGNLNNSATGLDHMYLTGVRRLAGASDDNNNDLITQSDWSSDIGLETVRTDENSSNTTIEYDDYWRLYQIKNHDNTVVQQYEYSYGRDQSGNDSFDPTKPNYTRVRSTHTYGGGTQYVYDTTFTDGSGRRIQTHRRNDTNDIITSWGYHTDGALGWDYNPYDISNATHAYHNTAGYGSRDSTLYEYESDPRRRPYRTTFPTMDTATRPQTTHSYAIESISGHAYLTRTLTDENSVAHKEWLNSGGSAFKQTIASSYASRTWSNSLGQPVMVLPPLASESTSSPYRTDITYSPVGMEIERDEPDQNTTRTVYDRALHPIWIQEAADAGGNDFWATVLDKFGRATSIGLEKDQSASWYTTVPTTPVSSYGTEADEWRKKFTYDSDQIGSGTTYPKGRLTMVEGNWDTDSTTEFWTKYQYAREGWVTRTYTNSPNSKYIYYEYGTGGRLRKVKYAPEDSSNRIYLWYDYDLAGRMYRIYSNTSDSKPANPVAQYTYNARGQVTQAVIKNTSGTTIQTIDDTYNARGFLTKINNPESLGTDRFAMQLGYDDRVTNGPEGGWSAENNGNISQMKWITSRISGSALYYTFGYNSRDFLTSADCSENSYDVSSYSYDNNGNLSGLNRGTAWTYVYEYQTNRVDSISGLNGGTNNWDYDDNGRQTRDNYGGFSSCTYHFPGAAFHNITMSGGSLSMRYDINNQRVVKDVSSGTDHYYVRDIEGRVLAVWSSSSTILERYIWGPTGLVAIIKGNNSSPTWYYTITDHLGSVRAVVDNSGTAKAGYDHYPYGMSMRSTIDSGADSRFLFQAKEFDTELSLDLYYFEARFYRPDIGRFVAPDPARVGWSYYSFCNNNPLRYIDPTGLDPQEPEDDKRFWREPSERFDNTMREIFKYVGGAVGLGLWFGLLEYANWDKVEEMGHSTPIIALGIWLVVEGAKIGQEVGHHVATFFTSLWAWITGK